MANEKWEKVQTSPTWDFKEEAELVGVFVEAESEVGPNKSNLYTFRRDDDSLIAVWGNTILDMRFKSLVKGDKVKVIYRGKATSPKSHREYNDFEVFKAKVKVDYEDIPVIQEDEHIGMGDERFGVDDGGPMPENFLKD